MEYADKETASDDYASRFAGSSGKWLLHMQERIITGFISASVLDSKENISVLDVGGGHGQVVEALCNRPQAPQLDITVLGSSPDADRQLHRIPQELKTHAHSLNYRVGDFLKLPFDDRSIDIVTCFRLLPHFDRWQDLLAELCRVTKSSLIIDLPTYESVNIFSSKLFGLKKRVEKNTRTYTLFHRSEIQECLAKNGFVHCDIRGQFLWPMVIHRMCKSPVISELLELPGRMTGLVDVFGSPVIIRAIRGE